MWTKRHCFPFKYHFILQKFSLWFASIYWKHCNINWCLCAWRNETKQKTIILLPFQATLYKHHWLLPRLIDMGPFLERPGNFSGAKANFYQNQNLLNSGAVPRSQTSYNSLHPFQNYWNFDVECKQSKHNFPGPKDYRGTFEKRAHAVFQISWLFLDKIAFPWQNKYKL